jgi:hypothetical protein
MDKNTLPLWFRVLGIATAINFVIFVAVTFYLGGDALNGYSADGHYYLSQKGKLTEVTEAVFTYSKWHAISLLVTFPIVIIGGMIARWYDRQF